MHPIRTANTVTVRRRAKTLTADDSLIERYVATYNAAHWDELRELLSTDYVHHSGSADLDFEGFRRGAEWIRRGVPDFTVRVEDRLAEGDRIAIRFTGSGTHTGSLAGEAPSGRSVTVYGTTIFRVVDGRISEDWEALDEQPFRALLAPV